MGKTSRREFLHGSAGAAAGLLAYTAAQPGDGQEHSSEHPHAANAQNQAVHHEQAAASQEFSRHHPGRGGPFGSATDRGKLVSGYRAATEPPVPVVMPDLEKLPSQMKDGVKEFHLVAQHVRREILPGTTFDFWGYNGSMPGPLIEAVEGDRVRIVVHNELPEATTVHWHGLELPNAMDGVPGLTQDPIPPGGKFLYEFDLHQNGTFFYHSHGGMQEIMGMSGLFVIHPRGHEH
jgi:FtsP/CotA-like multicopper oxidase with cupredoxin domain